MIFGYSLMHFLFNSIDQLIGLFLIISILQLPPVTQSVQCVENSTISLPINTTIDSFDISSENETVCRVDLTFNFSENNVTIHFQPSVSLLDTDTMHDYSNSSYILITNFNLTLTDALVTIRYLCKMDDCDQIFIRKTLSTSMVEFRTTDLQKYIRDSLYTSTLNSNEVTCAGRVCEKNQFCKGEIMNGIMDVDEYLFIRMHTKCVNKTAAEHNLVSLSQTRIDEKIHNYLSMLCNRPHCDGRDSWMKILSCAMKKFQLPLNKTLLLPSSSNDMRMDQCIVEREIHDVNTSSIYQKSDARNLSFLKFYLFFDILIMKWTFFASI